VYNCKSNSYSLFTSSQCHQFFTLTHVRAVLFSAFSMHYPQCKRRGVRMRNFSSPRRSARDVTRTRDGVTDETLSRKSVQDSLLEGASVVGWNARAWRHTNTFRNHGYNASRDAPYAGRHLLRSIGHTLATEEVETVGKVEYCGSIRTLRSIPDQVWDVCKVWLRSVHKREFV
jgi:hypothetical protein